MWKRATANARAHTRARAVATGSPRLLAGRIAVETTRPTTHITYAAIQTSRGIATTSKSFNDAPQTTDAPAREHRTLFAKILVANRGEIACRVMRTAQALGVETVAVYSEADRDALHVKMADEAYCIGPASAAESYLCAEKIIAVALRAGAQAVHPGYGFLSENAAFAEACAAAGLTFIGPPPSAIEAMGSKSASKEIMSRAGVPVVPGYFGEAQDTELLLAEAQTIGFPVLIKAVKGGGGKGMKIVERAEDFDEQLQSAQREALKSFGDARVLVEKYITRPRHVEVQVFGDSHGSYVYLFERDCSVQRRHQKVIEEAPAPHLSPEQRRAFGEKAVAAAAAVDYVGAGTVEFILDEDTGEFFFMEMNTRLQVEHPVTEMVTRTDLVEWQLEVAAGNPLPKQQHELALHGWAFEARVYAEHPERDFLPDTGTLTHYRPPPTGPAVRVETGVRAGDSVSVFYDPMIAKLVVWGPQRSEALQRMAHCLAQFEIAGMHTNLAFLRRLCLHEAFRAAAVDTGFIARHRKALLPSAPPPPAPVAVALAALQLVAASRRRQPWGGAELEGFRTGSPFTQKFGFVTDAGAPLATASVVFGQNKQLAVAVGVTDGESAEFARVNILPSTSDAPNEISVDAGDRVLCARVVVALPRTPGAARVVTVFVDGRATTLHLPEPAYAAAEAGATGASGGAATLRAPMPCRISHVSVKPGQTVKAHQTLLVLEAMKMEHAIKAPTAGLVKRVMFAPGALVPEKALLVDFEPSEGS